MNNYYRTRDDVMHSIAKRQKKLIPLNIVVAILSLVAALTIIFSPLITVDLSSAGEIIAELTTDTDEYTESEDKSNLSSITSLIPDTKTSFTTYSLLQVAFSDDPIEYISSSVADMLSDATDTLIEAMIPTIVESLSENEEINITPEEVESVLETLEALEKASAEDVDDAIYNIFKSLQDIVGSDVLTDDSYKNENEDGEEDGFYYIIRDLYDKTVTNTEDGTFSVEAMISVYASELLGDEDQIFTSYNDLVYNLLDSYMEDLSYVLDIAVIALKVFSLVMMFFAAMWLILTLFAFFHIFKKNKRFTMWYVKMFGFWPCLLFFILPLVAPSLLGSLLGESGTFISAIFGIISSTTWISGLCYILLWLVSVFWAFPIKRKIKKEIRELKAMQY